MIKFNKHSTTTLVSVLIITATLILACRFGPQPTPPPPTPTPAATSTPLPPLPPQVIRIAPGRGEELLIDAPVQLVFDQAMDAETVEDAFSIEPSIPGRFE